jgi:hypothetical protein
MDKIQSDNVIDLVSPHHFEHTLWMNELKFFEDEVIIYEHQLEKLVKRNDKDMLASLEQFQNKFIRQKEVLDELKHEIKVHEQKLGWAMQNDPQKARNFIHHHDEMRDQIETFKKIFAGLKVNFYKFLKKYHD